jgi:hypothetical protein
VSTTLADLITRLNHDGYEASFNARYGTVDISRVKGRPLLDPWPLEISPVHLERVLVSLKAREGVGSREAIDLLAAMIEQDIGVYELAVGPFGLDGYGRVIRPHLT